MRKLGLILVLVTAGFTQNPPNGSVVADPANAPPHYVVFFVSAEAYKNMPDEQRLAYISGWLDGRLNAGAFGNAKTIVALRDCTKGKTNTQIAAIVDKYVASHPEDWHLAATREADVAIDESICPIRK
jgi:hypothetical protein